MKEKMKFTTALPLKNPRHLMTKVLLTITLSHPPPPEPNSALYLSLKVVSRRDTHPNPTVIISIVRCVSRLLLLPNLNINVKIIDNYASTLGFPMMWRSGRLSSRETRNPRVCQKARMRTSQEVTQNTLLNVHRSFTPLLQTPVRTRCPTSQRTD